MENEIKTVFVDAYFQAIYKDVKVKVPTGEMKKGLFSEKPEMKTITEKRFDRYSDCIIDGARLAVDINETIKILLSENYEIISIFPVTSGSYKYAYENGNISISTGIGGYVGGGGKTGYSYGYGYSYTEGVIIYAKKKLPL